VAVYVAFSDESGVPDPRGEFLVAGYVASESEWPWFARAWQERVLDGCPQIPYLHMTEIRSRGWRATHSISFYEAERRVDEAVCVLQSVGPMSAFVSWLKRADLADIVDTNYTSRKKIPVGIDEPDYACYIGFIFLVLMRVHARYPDATKVNFVVSRKQRITENLNKVIDATSRFLNEHKLPHLSALLGDLIPASMELQLPLQAADVLCWHLQRYHSKSYDRTDESRIRKLLSERDADHHEWKREDFEGNLLAAIKESVTIGP